MIAAPTPDRPAPTNRTSNARARLARRRWFGFVGRDWLSKSALSTRARGALRKQFEIDNAPCQSRRDGRFRSPCRDPPLSRIVRRRPPTGEARGAHPRRDPVYGERGYRNATVKAVCDSAGLTERYFYESFANSEALLCRILPAVTAVLLETLRRSAPRPPASRPTGSAPSSPAISRRSRRSPLGAGVPGRDRRGATSSTGLRRLARRIRGAILRTFGREPGDPLIRKAVVGGVSTSPATGWPAARPSRSRR